MQYLCWEGERGRGFECCLAVQADSMPVGCFFLLLFRLTVWILKQMLNGLVCMHCWPYAVMTRDVF